MGSPTVPTFNGIRQSVVDCFIAFTESFEGSVPLMYCDRLGLVTAAYGNLINTPAAAQTLDWRREDGSKANNYEIAAEWAVVKNDRRCDKEGWTYARTITRLRLTPQGMAAVAFSRLRGNSAILRERYGAWDGWPASAQLALLSWAWACGPSSPYPQMTACLIAGDFSSASQEIYLSEWSNGRDGRRIQNVGVRPRNEANRRLLERAAETTRALDDVDWR